MLILISVHSASIVHHLNDTLDLSKSALAYYNFDFGEPAKQTVRGLLSSILIQMAEHYPDCHKLLKEFRSSNPGRSVPDDYKLWGAVKIMLGARRSLFLVIDALDECTKRERSSGLFRMFDEFMDLDLDLHLLVTSRHEFDIGDEMKTLDAHSISLHDTAQHLDVIKSYISTILCTSDYSDWPKAVKDKARQVLSAKSNGM